MFKCTFVSLYILIILFIQKCICVNLTVTTDSGKVFGKILQDRRGNDIYSFEAIPYANPPLGELRFKAPEPIGSWKNILNATHPPPVCPQLQGNMTIGQEDCLYLNIFTPMLPNSTINETLKSVMVYVHGGAFTAGSANDGNPDYLLPNDIVLVTINYRLGLLGFLNFKNQSSEVPGNAGMKDQVLALKWIKRNIKYFGGNPDTVTIFGESAGSASVNFLVLSPMSAGLFSKAIMQSATGLNLWGNGLRDSAKILCQMLNISTANDTQMLHELGKVSLENILKAQINIIPEFGVSEQQAAGIVVESQQNQPAFMPDSPINIIKSGMFNKVPSIIGYTSKEGLMLQLLQKQQNKSFVVIKDFKKYIPYDLQNVTQNLTQIADELYNFYYKNETNNDSYPLLPTINAITDTWFYYHIYKSAVEQLKTSNQTIYFYRFSADTKLNIVKRTAPELDIYTGAAHADDLGYEFKFSQNIIPGSIEDISIDRYTKLWSNFAKFGNPTPSNDSLLNNMIWKPFSSSEHFILEFGNTLNSSVNPDYHRYQFWEYIYNKYS